ncbi:hypothetical protein DNTS_015226 [Danionella cerebrum]|uniref:Serine/threonine-protein kinase 11-interacting protein n=1 Tax=Danionella cerebrum TaxID=2873325 RepID=A0A553QK33_9TELE|nr:hypothetical protein DNTS_015226 [Danionella translucida]
MWPLFHQDPHPSGLALTSSDITLFTIKDALSTSIQQPNIVWSSPILRVLMSNSTLVHRLASLLRNDGDSVLDGSSTLTLKVGCLHHLTQLFERHLLSRTHQHGFLALPSHPADTASLLELQFLFDMLQKTVSLKLVNPPAVKLQYVVKIFPFKSLKRLELKRIPPHCLEGLRGVYSQLEMFTCSKGVSSPEELLSSCGGDLSSALPWLELHTLNFSYNSISCLDESLSFSELEHLNLAYNNLQKAPELDLSSQAKLTTLILRNNQLETVNGIEQLSSLRCLDLAYNILIEHSQLAPLAFLHNLCTLTLEGNPLFFVKTHRTSTACHLSPKAALKGLCLDGSLLSQADLLVSVAAEQAGQKMSRGGRDFTDGEHQSGSGGSQFHRKKHKNKVKVRSASISEPSDTDYEISAQSAVQDIILPHKDEIERMDSFREQLGEDWLRYQHHLDGALVNPALPEVDIINADTNGHCTPPPSPVITVHSPPSCLSLLPHPLKSSELKEEEDREETESSDLLPETESTLQWSGHSTMNTESTIETMDLCRPMLVAILSEDLGVEGKIPSELLFLRMRQTHLLEVDVQQGSVKTRVDLDCLQDFRTTEATCTLEKLEKTLPSLELQFCYINRERQKRSYLMLDDNPQESLQELADVLSRILEENKQKLQEGRPETVWLQCLKCRAEFCQPASDSNSLESQLDEQRNENCTIICSECSSDHVVQLAVQSDPSTSTPFEHNDARYFSFDDRDNPSQLHPDEGLISGRSQLQKETSLEGSPACFYTAHSFLDQGTSRLPDGLVEKNLEDVKEMLNDGSSNSYPTHKDQPSPKFTEASRSMGFDLPSETVDHRLQLFLDVEVFEGEEELRCLLKMSMVKFGDPLEFDSLMVVSDQGQPSDWLKKRESHRLRDLCYLEVGLASQTLHMEFGDGRAAYTLLVRNKIAQELAPNSESKLKGISITRLNPHHHLWQLVCEGCLPCDEDSHPPFHYLLAFLQQEDSLHSVSVLATKEMLFLLKEDHQWSKAQGQQGSGRMAIHDSQPISCVSSIHLFSSNPCRMDLIFYDEIAKKEKTWNLNAGDEELLQGLVDWIKNQWENMFGVKLSTVKQ